VGDEPCFFIALPDTLFGVVPLNASKLLAEWERELDPLKDLLGFAEFMFTDDRSDWFVREHFVVPSWTSVELMRAAAHHPEAVSIFSAARDVRIHFSEPPHDPGSDSVAALVDHDHLRGAALPLLYGLAIVTTSMSDVSYHARNTRRALSELARDGGANSATS
jgi:hypothetical protein